MTSIQPQPVPRSDDHAARTSRRTGKSSSNAAPDAGSQFSSIFAESQRKLEADRLAALKDDGATQGRSKSLDFLFDDAADDSANASSAQRMPLAQDNAAPASQGAAAPSASQSTPIQTMSEDASDWQTLASLLPTGADDGVFEVLMPNRSKVGVAVSDMPAGLSYLLTPDDALLADRLRGHKMELEALLKRRIRRNVKVVVL